MSNSNVPKKTRKNNGIQPVIAILFLIISILYLFLEKKTIAVGIFHLLKHNLFEVLWNFFLTYLIIRAFIRIIIVPIWFFVFADNSMIGQKINWHKSVLPELQPEHQELTKIRFFIVLIIAFSLKMMAYIPFDFFKKWSLCFSSMVTTPKISHDAIIFFNSLWFKTASFFGVLLVTFWFLLIFEGRSRIIARILIFNKNRKRGNDWKKQLPEPVWNYKEDEFSVCIFNYFTDSLKNISYNPTTHEIPCVLSEKCLKTNTLVIAPTGGGKTSGFVVPLLQQGIKWQFDNYDKKASLAVYDPKAELTEFVEKIAIKEGREQDLCVLNFKSDNTLNPIHIDNVWDGQSSWKVASWIVNSWISFQGKASSEPYWETQVYILMRNILVMIYFYNNDNATLYKVSKTFGTTAKGCFSVKGTKRVLSEFGEYIILPYLKTMNSLEEQIKYLRTIESFSIDLLSIESKIKDSALAFLREEKSKIVLEDEELKKQKEILDDLIKLGEEASKDAQEEYNEKFKSLLNDEMEKIDQNDIQAEVQRHYLIDKASSLRVLNEKEKPITKDACEWFLMAWSSNNEDNRGSIVSSPLPFLQQFETPELKRIFSPENPTVVLEDIIKQGKIFVPSFSAIFTGQQLANAIISIVKSRWQHAVLSMPEDKRIKLQIMDEAQRVISFGGGSCTGDFEYMELSRSFGGITFLLSQSLSAIKARASVAAQFEKIHGVLRNVICLGTNDLQTIDYFKNLSGQTIKERISKTITETGQNPKMEMISEKYQGDTDSLGIAYTVSESQESRLQTRDIQEAKAFTAFASLYNGFQSTIYLLALKPHFWKNKCDKWELMNRCNFNEKEKENIL